MDLLKIWQNKLGQKYTWCINSIAPSNFITCPLMLFLVIMIDYRWCILCAHINSVNLSATIRLSHIYYNGTVYGALCGSQKDNHTFTWAMSLETISKQLHVPRPSVQTIVPRYKVHWTVVSLPRSGRKPKLRINWSEWSDIIRKTPKNRSGMN